MPAEFQAKRNIAQLTASILSTLLTITYPVIVYLGFRTQQLQSTGWMLFVGAVGILAIKAFTRSKADASQWRLAALAGFALICALYQDPRSLYLYPVLVSLGFLSVFGQSLRRGRTPIVEYFARRFEANLSIEKQKYCRRVTQVWCVYFVCNATIAALLAIAGNPEAWALYTSVLAYLGMAALFAIEYAIRRWKFRENANPRS